MLNLCSVEFSVCLYLLDGEVRLVNGIHNASFYSGRVEIFRHREWGTVCDDDWSYDDAKVVCKQLEYLRVHHYYSRSYFGRGTGTILLDDLSCYGNENSLLECDRATQHNCDHSEDAGLACSNGK